MNKRERLIRMLNSFIGMTGDMSDEEAEELYQYLLLLDKMQRTGGKY